MCGATIATSGCSTIAKRWKRADFHYVNTGTFEDLDAFVAGVMADLAGHSPRKAESD